MFRQLILALSFFSFSLCASQPTGKISSVTFFGKEPSEVIFVVIEPNESDCPYTGHFVMNTKDRPAMVSGLLAAFQAQNTDILLRFACVDFSKKSNEPTQTGYAAISLSTSLTSWRR